MNSVRLKRTSRQILILSLIIIAMLILVGCGGGGGEETEEKPTAQPGGAVPGSGATSGELEEIPTPSTVTIKPVDRSANYYPDEFAVNIEFKPNQDTPVFFKDALKKKKPIFLEFYGQNDILTDSMAMDISELQAQYKEQMTFILLNNDKPQTYGALASQLPIKYTPQIFIFNTKSTIIRSYTGYIDKDILEQGIYDAIYRGF